MALSAQVIDAPPKLVHVGETNVIGVDCTGWLACLGSSVTISSVATSDADGLTITSVARNSSTFLNDAKGTCAQYKGFQFTCAGQAASTTYEAWFAVSLSDGVSVKMVKVTVICV